MLGAHLIKVALFALGCTEATGQTPQVQATVETEPVPSSGDAADDAAIWGHPADSSLSLIIGTDKDSGLAAYDLAGVQVQFLADGELNNVDVRYDFLLLLAGWGPCPDPPEPCPADLDRNGIVGVTDFLILLSHWS